MMDGYQRRQGEQEEFETLWVEPPFETQLRNPLTDRPSQKFMAGGRADAIVSHGGSYFLVEHKTAARVDADYLGNLPSDFQIHYYGHYIGRALGLPIKGTIYNILGKSRLKIRKNESAEDYGERLRVDQLRPELYERFEVIFEPRTIERHRRTAWNVAKVITRATKSEVFTENPSECRGILGKCPYVSLCDSCDHPAVLATYEYKPAHSELIEEDSNESNAPDGENGSGRGSF
jgi:hypothetical protein